MVRLSNGSTVGGGGSNGLPRVPQRTSPKVVKRASPTNGHSSSSNNNNNGYGSRSHSGQSTLPSSPSNG